MWEGDFDPVRLTVVIIAIIVLIIFCCLYPLQVIAFFMAIYMFCLWLYILLNRDWN